MQSLPFTASKDFSLGIELEYQIICRSSYNLISRAKELIRNVRKTAFNSQVKPEITQSMLEINSSIHATPQTILKELNLIRQFLVDQANQFDILFCGGGTHPFQRWMTKKIFPTNRFRHFSKKYQYLSKRSTVFGQHIHIGCKSAENAIYLTHILARYVPQFIVLSASSPFYQGIDTGYYSSRATIFNCFPLSGTMPYLTDWDSFTAYYYKMKGLGVIKSIKDFFWDIRPKPEFGTVEIRVCDTPLTLKRAIALTAYIQSLACYILQQRPLPISEEVYTLHSYNRFQAARYGLEADFINPYTHQKYSILEDIIETIENIKPATEYLGNTDFIADLKAEIQNNNSDAALLREIHNETNDMKEVVRKQCKLWMD